MGLIDNTKNLFLLLTTLGAVIGVYLNSVNNFYFNLIKLKFKHIPIKTSVFKVIITWISIIAFFLDLIYLVYIIGNVFNGGWQKDSNINMTNMFSLSRVIAVIIVVGFIGFIVSISIFLKIRISFIEKLKTNKNINIKKNFIYINWANIISLGIISFFLLFFIVLTFVSNRYKEAISIIIFFLVLFTGFILATDLREFINAINDNYEYILIGSKEYVCKCYIDYDEYYLLFNNGIETYIKKSDIKEIIKRKSIV